MALDSCDWASPGADRYTGTATAAIHAFATIPEPVRLRLVAKHEKRAYDDIVHIDRDAIRGRKEAWDPAIRDMHFGSSGKRCGRVDRSMWSSAQVETAVVYCDSGYCVAWPSVCGNWFVIAPQASRVAMLAAATEDAGPAGTVDGDDDAAGDAVEGPVFGAEPAAPLLLDGAEPGTVALLSGSATADADGDGGFGGGGLPGSGGAGAGAPSWFASGSRIAPAAPAPATVVTPIPEPSTWAAMLAGLSALGALARRRRARSG